MGEEIMDNDVSPWLYEKVHREKSACGYDKFRAIPFFVYSMGIE
ncbi:MAG: hypothetical protein PHD70_07745 [Anaerostipes sp.]|nr:hypothetical protein [Anaerostipes sp.]